MAEIFGVVAGALSVAALFDNVVDCFEYIQLGRNFGTDYQTCQLRLDIARLRLSRWGAAVNINSDVKFADIDPAEGAPLLAKQTLEQILNLFVKAYSESSTFKLTARSSSDLAPFDPASNSNRVVVSLRSAMDALTRKRHQQTSLSKKISWALYKQKYLTRLVDDIHELLDGLESIFPQQEAYRRMAELEAEEIGDVSRLQVLSEAAQDDLLLREAVEKKLQVLASNTIDNASVTDDAKVRVGNEYITQSSIANVRPATNKIGDLDAQGNSRVHVGDSHGDSQFWNSK
ncbi:hypothetical protein GQ53DRAFT_734651 [Thozetella sp. PMI_491]|nr:hypothetical protein GQ53DRAFT_734651 [Thozetella sp. PMI_491]